MKAAQLEIWYSGFKLKTNTGQIGINLANNDLRAKEQREKKVKKVNKFKECNKNELTLK